MSLSKVATTIGQDGSRSPNRWCDVDAQVECPWSKCTVFPHADGGMSLIPPPKAARRGRKKTSKATLGLTASSSSSTGVAVLEKNEDDRREHFRNLAIEAELDELASRPATPQASPRPTPEVSENAFECEIHFDEHSIMLNEFNSNDIISNVQEIHQMARIDFEKGSFSASSLDIVGDFWVGEFRAFPTEKQPTPQSRNLCFSFSHGRTCCVHYATGKCNRSANKCNFLHTDIPSEVLDLLNTLQ